LCSFARAQRKSGARWTQSTAGTPSGGRIHDKELLYRGASQDDKSPIDPTDVAVASSAPAGLSGEEAGHLLAQYGENAIQERRVSMLRKFLL
jgi:Cation transporter/ATPase, N-terminus